MASALGDRLTQLRDEQELSNSDLAQAAGIDESTMGAILSGDIARPPNSRLRGLAELLGVSFDSLLELVPADRREEEEEDGAKTALASVSTELAAAPPDWVQLMPAGEVRTRPHDGREAWHARDLNGIVAATRAVGLPLVVDYEHQTEYAKTNGQPAPAAGWIDDVEARADGIYGRVAWTDRAKTMIGGREYRFLSPVFRYHPQTREVKRIVMAGLTNDRALADIQAFAKSEGTMDELIKKLRGLLGLDDDADEGAIAKAVGDLVEKSASAGTGAEAAALGRVASALGLEAGAAAEAIETAAAKAAATAAQAGTSAKEAGELKTRLEALEQERAEEKAAAKADAAIGAGKIVPAQRDWAVAYAARDPEGFDAFVQTQPQIVKPGTGGAPRTQPGRSRGEPDAEALAVAKAMGITPEEYRASAKALAAREEETA